MELVWAVTTQWLMHGVQTIQLCLVASHRVLAPLPEWESSVNDMSDLLTILSGLGKGYMSGQQYKQRQDLLTADREVKRAAAAADAEYKRKRLKLEQDKIDADLRKGFEDTELGQFKDALGSFDTQMSGFTSNVLKGKTDRERKSIARGEIGNILTRWNTLKNWYETPTISRRFPATPFDTFAKTRLGAPTWLLSGLASGNPELDIPVPELTKEDLLKLHDELTTNLTSNPNLQDNPEQALFLSTPLYSMLREQGMTDDQIRTTFPSAMAGRSYQTQVDIPDIAARTIEMKPSNFQVGGADIPFLQDVTSGNTTYSRLLPTQFESDPAGLIGKRLGTGEYVGNMMEELDPSSLQRTGKFLGQVPAGVFLNTALAPTAVAMLNRPLDSPVYEKSQIVANQKAVIDKLTSDPEVMRFAGVTAPRDYKDPAKFKAGLSALATIEPTLFEMPGVKEMIQGLGTGGIQATTTPTKIGMGFRTAPVPQPTTEAAQKAEAGKLDIASKSVNLTRDRLKSEIEAATKDATIKEAKLKPVVLQFGMWLEKTKLADARDAQKFKENAELWDQGFAANKDTQDRRDKKRKELGEVALKVVEQAQRRVGDLDKNIGYLTSNELNAKKTALLAGIPDVETQDLFSKFVKNELPVDSDGYKKVQEALKNNRTYSAYTDYVKVQERMTKLLTERDSAVKDLELAKDAQTRLFSAGAIGGVKFTIEGLANDLRGDMGGAPKGAASDKPSSKTSKSNTGVRDSKFEQEINRILGK